MNRDLPAYVEGLVSVIGHADRAAPLRDYCLGLVMPGERESVEPMAAVTAPSRVAAQHQSLLHFVGNAPWSDEKVLAKICEQVLPAIERHGPVEAWILDDTGFPKKGTQFGRRCTAVLRATRQQILPSRGIAVDCQSPCKLAGALSATFLRKMGEGCRAPRKPGCACGDRVQNQTGDRARSDPLGLSRLVYHAASSCWTPAMATTRACGWKSPSWD